MRHFLFAFVLILAGFNSKAQKAPTKSLISTALKIPDSLTKTTSGISSFIKQNFQSDSERLKAIFVWEATNIRYDVDNMFALTYTGREEKINKALETRMAICEGYAELFAELSNQCGIMAVVIQGYTKQKGMVDYIPHAWVAAKLDNKWSLFDPTWSSGYLLNGKFVNTFTNRYYKVQPAEMVKTHMPFDPMYQFMAYPLTAKEFYEGTFDVNPTKSAFNFDDSLTHHSQLTEVDKLRNTARRIENNGVRSSMIVQMLQYIKNSELNLHAKAFNAASNKVNEAINGYNQYIEFKNKQFNPKKEDPEIEQMLVVVQGKIDTATGMIANIKVNDPTYVQSISQLNSSISSLQKNLNEEKQFVAKYLKTKKLFRPMMFRKIG